MNGSRPVTEAELDAHLHPMREDIHNLGGKVDELLGFMHGAVVSRAIQERVIRSRHFWIGVASAMFSGLVAAFALIVQMSGH